MANKRQKDEKRDPRSGGMGRRLKEHRTGVKAYVKLPKGFSTFNPMDAKAYNLDFLMALAGDNNKYAAKKKPTWELTIYVHGGVLPGGGSHLCLRMMWNEPCPTCEREQQIRNDDPKSKEAKELANKIRPKERQIFFVRNLDDDPKQNRLWDVSSRMFGDHLENRIREADKDDAKKWETFNDLEKGMTVRTVPEKKALESNHYFDFTNIDFKPRKKQYKYDLIDELPALGENLLIKPNYKELKKLLDTGEAEAEASAKSGKGKGGKAGKGKGKGKEKEEEEEEDSESSDDSDESSDSDEESESSDDSDDSSDSSDDSDESSDSSDDSDESSDSSDDSDESSDSSDDSDESSDSSDDSDESSDSSDDSDDSDEEEEDEGKGKKGGKGKGKTPPPKGGKGGKTPPKGKGGKGKGK